MCFSARGHALALKAARRKIHPPTLEASFVNFRPPLWTKNRYDTARSTRQNTTRKRRSIKNLDGAPTRSTHDIRLFWNLFWIRNGNGALYCSVQLHWIVLVWYNSLTFLLPYLFMTVKTAINHHIFFCCLLYLNKNTRWKMRVLTVGFL